MLDIADVIHHDIDILQCYSYPFNEIKINTNGYITVRKSMGHC